MSERENIECPIQIFRILIGSSALVPKGDDALERPITLAIESIDRIALLALYLARDEGS